MQRRDRTEMPYNHITFDWYTVIKDILREWRGILMIAFAVFFLAYTVQAYRYHETYTMTTTFTVNSKSARNTVYQSLSSAQKTATSFQQIIDSSILRKKAAEELGMGSLPGTINVTVVENTNLITLAVTESKPKTAYDVMQAILHTYPEVSEKIMGDVVLTELQNAVIPEEPDVVFSPLPNMEKAFAAALVIMILLVGLSSMLRDTVRREWEVEQKLDAELLGALSHEKKYSSLRSRIKYRKAKKSILLIHPDVSFRYVESARKIASRVCNKMEHRNAKVVLVTSVLENEGKSTVAANLALAMAEESNKVLLIDCDFRKPAQYKIFDIETKDFVDLGEVLDTQDVKMDILYKKEGMDLWMMLNSEAYFNSTELISGDLLKTLFDIVKDKMDYIVVDSAPMTMVADTEELMDLVDASVLVVKQHTSTVRDINDSIDILNGSASKMLGVIFNDVGGENSLGHGYGGYSGYGGYGKYGSNYKRYGYGYYGGHYEKREETDEQ